MRSVTMEIGLLGILNIAAIHRRENRNIDPKRIQRFVCVTQSIELTRHFIAFLHSHKLATFVVLEKQQQ